MALFSHFCCCQGGVTALHACCARGFTEGVELLLPFIKCQIEANKSKEINRINKINEISEINETNEKEDSEKPRGAPPEAPRGPLDQLTDTGGSPLLYAASKGHLDIVKLLLEHGADVNQKGYGNHTALSRAICAGRKAVISFLLTVPGVDLNVKETGTGDNLLHLAVNSGLADVYWQIAQAAPHLEDEKNKDGMTPVGTARMDFMKELEKEIKNLKTEEE